MENSHVHMQPESMPGEQVNSSVLKELEELRHYKDTTLGLWCVDQDPKEKSLDWIRANTFQLT